MIFYVSQRSIYCRAVYLETLTKYLWREEYFKKNIKNLERRKSIVFSKIILSKIILSKIILSKIQIHHHMLDCGFS